MCMYVHVCAVCCIYVYIYRKRERVFFSSSSFFFSLFLTLKHTHIRTQEGNSCLHIAAAQGSNEILRILLNAGANITAKNKADNTAVERAQNAQTVEVLKAAGATMPEIPDKEKNTLLRTPERI